LQDNHVGDHGVVEGVGVFGYIEILLDDTTRVGKERPVGADSATILVRLSDVVGADRDQPAIGDLELAMELNQPFSLPAVFRAKTASAEDEDHGMLSLQFGELPALCHVVGKLIIGKDRPWNYVRSHMKSFQRSDLNAARTSPPKSSGCSHAALFHKELPGDPVRILEGYVSLVQCCIQLHSRVPDTGGR